MGNLRPITLTQVIVASVCERDGDRERERERVSWNHREYKVAGRAEKTKHLSFICFLQFKGDNRSSLNAFCDFSLSEHSSPSYTFTFLAKEDCSVSLEFTSSSRLQLHKKIHNMPALQLTPCVV